MSKGYYAILPIVFHNQENKNKFLEENKEYIHIDKKTLANLMKRYTDKEIICKSCNKTHIHGSISWSKLDKGDTNEKPQPR